MSHFEFLGSKYFYLVMPKLQKYILEVHVGMDMFGGLLSVEIVPAVVI